MTDRREVQRKWPDFRCSRCGWEVEGRVAPCPHADGLVEADYSARHPTRWSELIAPHAEGIWRYEAALPPFPVRVSRAEGGTPLLESRRIGVDLRVRLAFKDETRNPTGSFKDRAAAILVSEAVSSGCTGLALTSSGNAGASLAMYCALAGLGCAVYAAEAASEEKLLQAQAFGAKVVRRSGWSEEQLAGAAREAASELGWGDASTVAERCPLAVEGYKTMAYEIGALGVPDAVAVPVGAGTLLLGLWKGFRELRAWGITDDLPRMIGVQPLGWDAVTRAFERGEPEIHPQYGPPTIASGAALGDPGLDGRETLRAVRESGGSMVAVSDDRTLSAQRHLARMEGILAEPSGALSLAGVECALRMARIRSGERVVAVVTGAGLKDQRALGRIAAEEANEAVSNPASEKKGISE